MDEKRKRDDLKQSKRFVETARTLETDESGKSFEKLMDALSKESKYPAKTKKPGQP